MKELTGVNEQIQRDYVEHEAQINDKRLTIDILLDISQREKEFAQVFESFKISPEAKLSYDECKRICLEAVKRHPFLLGDIPEEKLDDNDYAELCLEAVKKSSHVFMRCVPKKYHSYDVCLMAVKSDADNLSNIAYRAMRHFDRAQLKSLYIEAVRQKPMMLDLVKYPNFDDDDYIEICLEAVQRDGMALRHVDSDNLAVDNYNKVCLQAVRQDGMALQYVSELIDDYKVFCLEAVSEDKRALRFVPEAYKKSLADGLSMSEQKSIL